MKLFAPAKINLCLDILKKDATGYHKIQTIFNEIELSDEIEINSAKEKDFLSIRKGKIQKDPNRLIKTQDNLAFKALQLIKNEFQINKFAEIKITKNIPLASGLGGASSNAATVLKGLNKLWELNLSDQKLMELGAQLGMDVPFFIVGGTALGENYGEKITPLKRIENLEIKLHERSNEISFKSVTGDTFKTASMFAQLDLSKCGKNTDKTKACLEAIKAGDTPTIIKSLHNDFETLSLYKNLPQNHYLTGSGPSTFEVNAV